MTRKLNASVEDYFYIAEEVAKRKMIPGINFEDLLQEGYLSVIETYSLHSNEKNLRVYIWKNTNYRVEKFCEKFLAFQNNDCNTPYSSLKIKYDIDLDSKIDLEEIVSRINFRKEEHVIIFWRIFYGDNLAESTEGLFPQYTKERKRQIATKVVQRVKEFLNNERKGMNS